MEYFKVKRRPVVPLSLSRNDKIIEASALALLVFLWIWSFCSYGKLPEVIPAHFNFKGRVDGFAHKSSLWGTPAVATGIYLLLTVLNRFPYIFNYIEEITIDNAKRQYSKATRTLRILKLIVVVIFAVITYFTVSHTGK